MPVAEAAVAGREELVSSLDAVARHNALAEAFAKIARALANADPEAEARSTVRERSERRAGSGAMANGAIVEPQDVLPPVTAETLSEPKTEPSDLVGLGYGIKMPTATVETPLAAPSLRPPGSFMSMPTPALSIAPLSNALSQVETPPLSMPMLSPVISRSGVVARASAADLWASGEVDGSGDAVMVVPTPSSIPSRAAQVSLPSPVPSLPSPTIVAAPFSASRATFNQEAPAMRMQRSASADGPPQMHPDRLRAISSLPNKPRLSAPPATTFAGTSSNSVPLTKRYFEASLPAKPTTVATAPSAKSAAVAALPVKPHDVEPPWRGPAAPADPTFSPPRGPRSWVSPTSEAPPTLGLQIRGRARGQVRANLTTPQLTCTVVH